MPNALVLFGKQLRKLRESRNLSQEKLAELCDYQTNQIGRIERGERTVSFEGIIRIAYGLSMPPSELFKLIPAPKGLPRRGEYAPKDGNSSNEQQHAQKESGVPSRHVVPSRPLRRLRPLR